MNLINVGIVDDMESNRQGLNFILSHEDDIETVFCMGSGQQLLANMEVLDTIDVLLLDLIMYDVDGISVVRFLKQANLSTKVLVVSNSIDKAKAKLLTSNGVLGLISKHESSLGFLPDAIRSVAMNKPFISPGISSVLYGKSDPGKNNYKTGQLPEQHLKLLRLIAETGATSAQLSEQTGYTKSTIDTMRSYLNKFFEVENSIQLVQKARREGLLDE